ncbi:MAG: hypothetical protein FWG41_04110 [Methanomassiliicoccaceae archaeon]|nr:hypothetical protein [Methanomassiliicoccaceae archaeon]
MMVKKGIFVLLAIVIVLISVSAVTASAAGENSSLLKENFGGAGNDYFVSIAAASDGFVAVGYSDSFGDGDWTGVEGKGDIDATIVKYNNDGQIEWRKNFGGEDIDHFCSVTAVSDGFVVAGYSYPASFGNGDWTGVKGKGSVDAILVKYDDDGNVVWKKNFGGAGEDYFSSVTAVQDGFVTAGYSSASSFGNGDWGGIKGSGGFSATLVKYDNDGNIVWKKSFGGSDYDYFMSVAAVPDGVVAVGYSHIGSNDDYLTGIARFSRALALGNDWTGVKGKGGIDATIVKYDDDGNVVWKKCFGGSDGDYFDSVAAVSDGIVAVGYSLPGSFGNGDWAGVKGKGGVDAIAVKYNSSGGVVWKKNFGGSGNDQYHSVTAVSDGFIAVGHSSTSSFGNGDWGGTGGRGSDDAIVVKYDNDGKVVWKKNFGGNGSDRYYSVAQTTKGNIAVGDSFSTSFGNGDWRDTESKGSVNAIATSVSPDMGYPEYDDDTGGNGITIEAWMWACILVVIAAIGTVRIVTLARKRNA